MDSASIIQVNRPLRMRAKDPVPAREFYFDLGRRDGLREGMVLEVVRTMSVVDGRTGSVGYPLRMLLGELVVVGVDERVGWGRAYRVRNPQDLPTLDLAGFIVGDEVRVKTRSP